MRKWHEAYAQLGTLIEWGVAQVDREGKLMSLLEHRRKQSDSETRRKLAEAKTFTIEEAAAYYKGLGTVVRRHILDPDPNLTPQERLRRVLMDMRAISARYNVGDGA
jgi:hypothetical protein